MISRLITIRVRFLDLLPSRVPNNIHTIAIINNYIIRILISKPQKSTQLLLQIIVIYWRKFYFVVKYMHKDLENLQLKTLKFLRKMLKPLLLSQLLL